MKLSLLTENKSKTIYLDLDETLIYTSSKFVDNSVNVSAGYTVARPFLHKFLSTVQNKGYVINLLTYGTRKYAREVLNAIKIMPYFNQIIAREDIIDILSKNIKLQPGPLIDNEMPEHKIKIVDGNKYKIKSWYGNKYDKELLNMLSNL